MGSVGDFLDAGADPVTGRLPDWDRVRERSSGLLGWAAG